MGAGAREAAEYFDLCRIKRNISAYDRSGEISRAEAQELISEASAFRSSILAWLKAKHPRLVD
jgi:hypothetical protein